MNGNDNQQYVYHLQSTYLQLCITLNVSRALSHLNIGRMAHQRKSWRIKIRIGESWEKQDQEVSARNERKALLADKSKPLDKQMLFLWTNTFLNKDMCKLQIIAHLLYQHWAKPSACIIFFGLHKKSEMQISYKQTWILRFS